MTKDLENKFQSFMEKWVNSLVDSKADPKTQLNLLKKNIKLLEDITKFSQRNASGSLVPPTEEYVFGIIYDKIGQIIDLPFNEASNVNLYQEKRFIDELIAFINKNVSSLRDREAEKNWLKVFFKTPANKKNFSDTFLKQKSKLKSHYDELYSKIYNNNLSSELDFNDPLLRPVVLEPIEPAQIINEDQDQRVDNENVIYEYNQPEFPAELVPNQLLNAPNINENGYVIPEFQGVEANVEHLQVQNENDAISNKLETDFIDNLDAAISALDKLTPYAAGKWMNDRIKILKNFLNSEKTNSNSNYKINNTNENYENYENYENLAKLDNNNFEGQTKKICYYPRDILNWFTDLLSFFGAPRNRNWFLEGSKKSFVFLRPRDDKENKEITEQLDILKTALKKINEKSAPQDHHNTPKI